MYFINQLLKYIQSDPLFKIFDYIKPPQNKMLIKNDVGVWSSRGLTAILCHAVSA